MKPLFIRFLRDQSGQDKVEYALIAGLIALLLIGSERNLSSIIGAYFQGLGNTVNPS